MKEPTPIKLTEDIVANALWRWREKCGHWTASTRSSMFAYESDFLSISKEFAYDHEIKLTRSDYLSEFKKVSKRHKHFWFRDAWDKKQANTRYVPNYYFFVTPKGMLKKGDTFPHYAGLIEFELVPKPYSYVADAMQLAFTVRRKAPLLHATKLTDAHYRRMCRALSFRFFNARAKVNGVEL